jgi:hypothetical protein
MPRKRPRKKGYDESNQEHNKGEERQPEGKYDIDPVQIHRDYVERRVGGGAPPTPGAYARASEQWHRLPGAVRVPPTEVTGEQPAPPPPGEPDKGSHERAES